MPRRYKKKKYGGYRKYKKYGKKKRYYKGGAGSYDDVLAVFLNTPTKQKRQDAKIGAMQIRIATLHAMNSHLRTTLNSGFESSVPSILASEYLRRYSLVPGSQGAAAIGTAFPALSSYKDIYVTSRNAKSIINGKKFVDYEI